jgi:4-hydroxyphenylpyruvate dioxygenase
MSASCSSASSVVRGFDYIELAVGNVRHAAHYYQTIWGFQPVAFRAVNAGQTDRTSLAMRQGNITLLLSGAVRASSAIAETFRLHGESVMTIGLQVDDAEAAYEAAVASGATSVSKVSNVRDDDGQIVCAEVRALAGFTYAFIERSDYRGAFSPGFRPIMSSHASQPIFNDLDHVAVAVEAGTLNAWVDFHLSVFGFQLAHEEDVATEYTAMRSKVVQHPSGACKVPLVEPAPGKRKSQVQAFLDEHNGPGVQHLAVSTQDIAAAVTRLRNNGVDFLPIPASYYDGLESRVGSLGRDRSTLQDLQVLLDHDQWGRLLQIFARPCNDRPTLFWEIVERRGARGFGGGNIRALFESIEREQKLRGAA